MRRRGSPGLSSPALRRASDRGGALLTVLFVLFLVHLVLLVVTTRVIAGAQGLNRSYDRARAFHAAEAGLSEAVQRLARNLDGGEGFRRDFGDSSVAVEVTEVGQEGPWTYLQVGATGRSRAARQPLQLVLAVRPSMSHGVAMTQLEFVTWSQLPLPPAP